MERATHRAVFLDRDGVLNFDSPNFIKSPEELILIPGVGLAIARLNHAEYLTPVITNQSGIGRGLFTPVEMDAIHVKLVREISDEGGRIDKIYVCPHHPDDQCDCRKPNPGLIIRAAQDWQINMSNSWFVGDKPDDIVCAQNAGCGSILVLSGKTICYDPAIFKIQPDHVARNLTDAANWLLSEL